MTLPESQTVSEADLDATSLKTDVTTPNQAIPAGIKTYLELPPTSQNHRINIVCMQSITTDYYWLRKPFAIMQVSEYYTLYRIII